MESLCIKKAPADQVEIMFEKAASACATTRCRFFEALSNERLPRLLCREESNKTKRSKYLKRAAELYRSWGAVAKAEWLENRHDNHISCRELGVVSSRGQLWYRPSLQLQVVL